MKVFVVSMYFVDCLVCKNGIGDCCFKKGRRLIWKSSNSFRKINKLNK